MKRFSTKDLFKHHCQRIVEKVRTGNRNNNNKGRIRSKSSLTLRSKLIISFLIPIAFIVILGFVSFYNASKGLRNNYEKATRQTIEMTSEYFQMGVDEIDILSTQYVNDENLNKYLLGLYNSDPLEFTNQTQTLQNQMNAKVATDNFISQITILSAKSKTITSGSMKLEEDISSEFYHTQTGEKIEKNPSKAVWVGKEEFLDEKLQITNQNYSLRLIRKFTRSDALLIVDMDSTTVQNILKSIELDKNGIVGFITQDGKEIIAGEAGISTNNVFINEDFYQNAVKSENISGAEYVDYKGVSNLFLYSKLKDSQAMICAIIPKSSILSQANSIKWITIIIVLIASIIAVSIGIVISKGIDNTIKDIIKKLQRTAKGDLSVHFTTKRKDEFKILIDEINITFANMKELIKQVEGLSKNVSDASIHVSETSDIFLETSQNISNAMNEIEQGVMQQANDAEDCLQQMDDLSNKIVLMNDNTNAISTLAEETKISVREGTMVTLELTDQTKSTIEISTEIINNIEELGKKSESINGIINVINDISNQTNLLSLNASIEAARAGEVGKGFAVVANEIRNLAIQTRNSVNDIKEIIELIQQKTKDVTDTAKKAETVMLKQEIAVKNTSNSYQVINEKVDNLIINLSNIVEHVSNMETSRLSTLGAIENMSAVLEEIVASTNSVTQMAGNQLESVGVLNDSSGNLEINAETLIQAIQKFNVR